MAPTPCPPQGGGPSSVPPPHDGGGFNAPRGMYTQGQFDHMLLRRDLAAMNKKAKEAKYIKLPEHPPPIGFGR